MEPTKYQERAGLALYKIRWWKLVLSNKKHSSLFRQLRYLWNEIFISKNKIGVHRHKNVIRTQFESLNLSQKKETGFLIHNLLN